MYGVQCTTYLYNLYHEAHVRELESKWGAETKREAEGMNPIRKLEHKVTLIIYISELFSKTYFCVAAFDK